MAERVPRTIDMTPEGEFVLPPQPATGASTWAVRLGFGAAVIAALAGALAVAAVFLWVASIMIPVAVIAGLIAYGAFRFQLWRGRRSLSR